MKNDKNHHFLCKISTYGLFKSTVPHMEENNERNATYNIITGDAAKYGFCVVLCGI